MYSIILMAAVTTGSATTGNWFSNGCHGCVGHGWGYQTYHGNLCHGGYGCAGYGGYASYGPYASHSAWAPQGNFSVYAPTSCVGCFGCYGCYGCYGGWSCYGAALPHHGYWHECPPAAPKVNGGPKIEETPIPKEQKKKVKEKAKEKNQEEQVRAKVTIAVPADARLFIDGQLMKSTGTQRTFVTPDLAPGQAYFYDLKVEIDRDGRTIVDTKRVILHPGQQVSAAFPDIEKGATATAQNK